MPTSQTEEGQPENSQAGYPFALGDAAGEGMQKDGERVGLAQGSRVRIDGSNSPASKPGHPHDHGVDGHFAPLTTGLDFAPGRDVTGRFALLAAGTTLPAFPRGCAVSVGGAGLGSHGCGGQGSLCCRRRAAELEPTHAHYHHHGAPYPESVRVKAMAMPKSISIKCAIMVARMVMETSSRCPSDIEYPDTSFQIVAITTYKIMPKINPAGKPTPNNQAAAFQQAETTLRHPTPVLIQKTIAAASKSSQSKPLKCKVKDAEEKCHVGDKTQHAADDQ